MFSKFKLSLLAAIFLIPTTSLAKGPPPPDDPPAGIPEITSAIPDLPMLYINGSDLPCDFTFNGNPASDVDPGCTGTDITRTINVGAGLAVGNYSLSADGGSDNFLVFIPSDVDPEPPSDCPCADGWTSNGVDTWVGADCTYTDILGTSSALVENTDAGISYILSAQFINGSSDPVVSGCALDDITTPANLVPATLIPNEAVYDSCIQYLVDNGVCPAT